MVHGDNWSRRTKRSHRLFCLDLSNKRNATLVLLSGTLVALVLLTARYRLAHPDDHPFGRAGSSIGSQAYQPAFHWRVQQSTDDHSTQAGTNTQGATIDDQLDNYNPDSDDTWMDLDGWDDPYLEKQEDPRWNPLVYDKRPITELTIKSCVLPPGIYDMCTPEDALRGKWVRVERDLNRNVGMYYLYLFERRLLPNSKAPVITNLTLLTHSPTSDDLSGDGLWVEVSESIRTGVWPRMPSMFLHYQLTEQSVVRDARKSSPSSNAGQLEPITEIDVIYGGNEVKPLWGFEDTGTFITGGEDDDKKFVLETGKGQRFGSRLTVRRTSTPVPKAPTLRFSKDGKFTILQVADLHFSVGPGECRDLDPERERECRKVGSDIYTIEWLKSAIKEANPSLIVLSGDQLNGQKTSWSSPSTILKWAPILWEAKIPWTVIFGNHDGEIDLPTSEQMTLLESMPYFVGEAGPNIGGTGNYVRSIKSWDSSNTTLFNLYFLDSHANLKSFNFWDKGYDFIKPAQINWFKGKSSRVQPIKRPYSPPRGAKAAEPQAGEEELSAYTQPTSTKGRPKTGGKPKGGSKKPATRPRPPLKSAYGDEDAAIDVASSRVAAIEAAAGGGGGDDSGPTGYEDDRLAGDDRRRSRRRVKRQWEEEAPVREEEEGEFEEPGLEGTADPTEQNDVESPSSGGGYGNDKETEDLPPEGSSNDEYGDIEEEEEFGLEPTVLPAGPTRANPMTAKPNAITFFHIPLPESYDSPIDVGADGKRLLVGERFEGNGASKTNSGMFDTALAQQGELLADESEIKDEFWEGEFSAPTSGRPEVKVVANGHCHISEDCRRVKGVWLCFGGGASYSGYGKAGFARRMRVYELSDYGETIETYKLLDTLKQIDRVKLAGEGALGSRQR
ncbi:hypothetical protein T439DRAFT_351508 [Meredithblackwellia eburnea MCA 4105]